MVLLRAAAAYLCAEVSFWCWATHKRQAFGVLPPPYADAVQPPSGRPFEQTDRRLMMARVLATEFGVRDPELEKATTPERGRAWFSGWFFDKPFEQIDREQGDAHISTATRDP